ncbi:MAG: SusC/RagA family TonB-linked outer membrane protein [Clostridium sp.]|nr:SusC/RagA family TonB-linked outer membrane protein [Bacteroides sp.]MCM1197416.1 SusC/RagA family TonB-linked outer membrane protein [Clostridium sp.]
MKRFLILFLMMLTASAGIYAQTRNVSGKVLDDNGEPLPGAFVQIVGTTRGASADIDGAFTLENVSAKDVLRVSYMGFNSVDRVAEKEWLEIVLQPDNMQIQEVVVTGMQKMDKRMFTGATDNLKADDVLINGISEISRGLEGRAAGVSVQNVSGTFGAAPKIRVRGATSIFGDSKPLWVVDGVIMEDVVNVDANSLSSGDATTLISSAIAGLNADDIESFNILKDGSATSIYGARAMAGVIVITTKKGTAGQVRVNYSGEATVRLVPSYSEFNIMNSQEQIGVYEEMYRKGWLNYSNIVYSSQGGVYQKLSQLINTYDESTGRYMVENTEKGRLAYLRQAEMRNTDWFSELFRNSVMHNHSVSISAGTDKGTYYASLGAMVDPGWTVQSKVNRYTALFNMSQRLFKDKLTLNLIGNASYRNQRAPGSLSSEVDAVFGTVKRDFDINPYSYALRSSRTLDPDEFYTRNYAPFNIKHELNNNYMDINVGDIKVQMELKYHPIPKVEIAALGSVRYQATSTEHHILDDSNQAEAYRADYTSMIISSNPYLYQNPDILNSTKYSILPNGGIYTRRDYSALSQDFRATASYNDTFKGKHIINALGVVEINAIDRRSTSFQGWGLQYNMGETPFYILDMFKKQLEDNLQYYSVGNTHERNAAFAGTFSYSYDYRYTLNGTVRYEGSNRLGRSRSARWLPTWNIAGKWAVDQEKFFEKLRPALSTLNFRLSYSLTADRGPAWVNNSTVTIYASNPWRGDTDIMEPSLVISSPENSELTYEKKHEMNFGFDIGFIDNRISLSMDVYKRNNFDLIGNVITSGLGGFVNKMGNVAEMTSSGVELSLNTRNIETKDFSWTTNFIFAHMDNRVTKLNTSLRTIDYLTGSGYSMEGYPRGSLFSLKFRGLDNMGVPTFEGLDGQTTSTDLYFQETKNFSNLKYEGPSDPTITGSFGNVFKFKGFTLNVFMTYSFGNVVRLDPVFSSSYSDLTAMPKEFNNRFLNAGDERITNVPVILSKRQLNQNSQLYTAYSAYNYSDVRVAKGDFIRMKEISLSYDFPKSVTSAMLLKGLGLKFQATNPFLIYSDKKLNGQDPEFFNTGGVAVPMPKQFTLTLKITF